MRAMPRLTNGLQLMPRVVPGVLVTDGERVECGER
jgi:hypothetical protein